jgi:hypothetical protein
MSISGVQKLRYEEMVSDILNKIIITSKKGLLWTVEALEYMVMRNKKVPKGDHIPQPIYERAKQIRELIKDKDIYVQEEGQSEFVDIVKQTVGRKIKELLWMSNTELRNKIKADKKLLLSKQQPRVAVSHLREHERTVDTTEEVELKDQWRTNLMFPFVEDDETDITGLTIDEMARLSNLIDNDKYNWIDAQLLTANLPLAHWLSSTDISDLILNGILDIRDAEHAVFLTEPSAFEMKRLGLLSPVLLKGLITVKEALDIELDEEDENSLLDNAFRERMKTLAISAEDMELLSGMGILENQEVDDLTRRIASTRL